MANPEHLAILRKGIQTWNKWRRQNPGIRPNLRGASLSRADLGWTWLDDRRYASVDFREVDLSGANLRKARLSDANLRKASLRKADLREAHLCAADLREADLRNADLREASLDGANLRKADLSEANFRGANFFHARFSTVRKANLSEANLRRANLSETDLREADLRQANLRGASLFDACLAGANTRKANLSEADLRQADLSEADLRDAKLRGANLSKALLWRADLREADLRGADLTGVVLADDYGTAANFGGAKLTGAQFTMKDMRDPTRGFLELATADGLETADFGNRAALPRYLAEAFDYAHQPDLEEKKKFPRFVEKAVAKIKALRGLYGPQEAMPAEVVEVVRTITAELIKYLQRHPKAMYTVKPRQFEELIAEVLSSYGWQVVLTPASKDGGYDLYAIVKDAPGAPTSWIIECKKYAPQRKVGVEIVQRLWGIKLDLRVANAMLATTSWFTKGAQAFKSSRYDLALRDYEGILEWINEYRPHPDGKLYIRDHHIVLPGEKPPKAGP